jgi:hypothetical protein
VLGDGLDLSSLADDVRHTLHLPDTQPVQVRQRWLPDSVVCALANTGGTLLVLVDLAKPLASEHAQQLLSEVTNLAGLLPLA